MARQRNYHTVPAASVHNLNTTWSFLKDFYYRIHIYPSRIEIGNLTERLVYTIEFFNAFLTSASLTSVTPYDNGGVNLEPIALPKLILSLTSFTAELEIILNGPATLNARYVFGFSLGPELDLLVTGTRITTFSISPDWSETVSERLSFLTQILESRDGTEQRIALRQIPRWTFRYSFLEGDDKVNLVDSLLTGWGARSYAVPNWIKKTKILNPISQGALTINCDTQNRGFVNGGLCVLWRDALYYDTLEVASFTASQVTVARPVSKSYNAAYLIPATFCHLVGDRSEITALTSGLLTGEVEFESDEVTEIPAVDLTDKYQGLAILPYKHDYSRGRERALQRMMFFYDTGLGKYSRVDLRGFPLDEISFNDVLLTGHGQVNTFKNWLMALYGPQKPFYMVLAEDQLRPTRPLDYGSNMLYVASNIYGLLESTLTSRKTLVLRTKEERFIFNVTSFIGTSMGDLLLYVDMVWPRLILQSEIVQIGFLVKGRMNQDEFEFEYSADTLAKVSFNVKGIVQ
jgi:hypothetical protein